MSRELNINKQATPKTVEDIQDTPNAFLDSASKKKGIGDLINSNSTPIQGFRDSGETEFMNTKEYTDYTQKVNRGVSAFPFQSDYEKSRAINQSGWEQTRRTLGKLLPKTALEFVGQVGNVLDFEDYANTDNEVGNWLNTWAQDKKQELDEYAPTYRVNPDTPLDIGDSAWWLQSGSSLVESATAFVGLGYLAGAGTLKLLNNGGKALEFLQMIGKGTRAADSVKKGTQVGSGLVNTLLLNQAEGVGIAANAYNNIYADTVDELTKTNPELSEEEIDAKAKQVAADGAASVINYNRVNMLLNVTSAFAFIKTPNLTRELRKLPSVPKSLKHMGMEGLQEAGEETINMLAENQAYDNDYTFDKALNDVLTAEGAESALLGFVGGAGQTALTNAGRSIRIKKDENGNRYSINDRQRAQYADQQASKSKIEALSKAEKLGNVTDAYLKANETYQLYTDINKAIENKDNAKAKELTDKLVSVQAYDAFANGTTEQYINVFKGIQELTPEEVELKGLDKKTYKEQSTKAIKKIEALEKEYNKASGYINFNEVYDNKAKTLSLKDSKTTLENALNEERTTLLSDLENLGIKDSDITFSETGGISFNNYNKYGDKKKKAINNLVSLKEYKDTKDTIVSLAKSINRLTEAYANLTSEETQDNIKKQLKEQQKLKKEIEAKIKVAEKQTKVKEKNNKETTKFANEVEIEEANTEIVVPVTTDTETVPSINTKVDTVGDIQPVGFTFTFAESMKEQFEEGSNAVMNSNVPTQAKIKKFQELIQRITPYRESSPDVNDTIKQLQNAIKYLDTQLTEEGTANNTANTSELNNAKNALLDATEDLAPITNKDDELSEDEQKLIKQSRLIKVALNAMEEAGLDTNDFKLVANFTQDTIGKSKFVRIFETFKALYNISKPSNVTHLTYGDIFFDMDTKKKIVENKRAIDNAKAFAELYAISDLDFNKEENNALKEIVEKQNFKVFKKDKVTSEDVKIIEGYNKLAHLDKKYKTNVKVELTGMFNVLDFVTSKEDLDNELNDTTSHIALDYDKFNVGSEITLVPLNEVVYADGSIAYADGRVEKDGVIIHNDKTDFAPIGILYNGELLKGHYLHTTEWINENNIADFSDVKRQKGNMRKIREAVLASENGVTTTIRDRSNGHFMRNVYGITDTVAKNLPNVEIAIGKDGSLFTGDTDIVVTENNVIKDGLVYAVMPVNKGKKYAVPVKRTELKEKPEYVESILEAVKLYLNNNPNDVRARSLVEDTNIDITTINGLKTYLEKFLFLNPVLDTTSFMYDNFKSYVENEVREDASVIRIVTDPNNSKIANIEFGRGANVGDTIRFINRDIINSIGVAEGLSAQERAIKRRDTIDALLNKLKNVLENNTRINIVKNNFNKSFQLSIINSMEVVTKELPYNEFVKEHTNTDLYSYTLDTGKEIYTVQPNYEFDVTFAFKPVVKDTKETIIENTVTEVSEEDTEFDPFEDIDDLDIDHYAPKTLTKEQQASYENEILDSLFITDIGINLQEVIINNITSNVLKKLYNKDNIYDPLTAIDDFFGIMESRKKSTIDALHTDISEDKKEIALKTLTTIQSIINSQEKLANLVLNNLQQYHGLIKDGKALTEIRQAIEDEEINFDDFDELIDDDGVLKEYNDWDSDAAFTKDFKRRLSQEIKNQFGYVEDVQGFKVVDNKRIAIPKKVWGLAVTIPFDQIFNELSAILAYSNYQEDNDTVTMPTLDSMKSTIEQWIPVKPYLHNVLEILDNTSEELQNTFVNVMSKSYTHHLYIFKNKKGNLIINSSDSNNIVKVIQNEWLSNIIESNLITSKDGEYTIDEKMVNEISREANELQALIQTDTISKEEIVNTSKVLLDKMGFKFPKPLINTLLNEGIFYNKKRFSLLRLFSESDGAFKVYLDRLNSIKGKTIEKNPLFNDATALNKFTREIGKLHPVYFTNSFKDVRGRTYYGYSPNKFITDRVKALKTNNKDVLTKLSEQPFSAPSYWVQQFKNNPKFKAAFGYYTFDGRRNEGGRGKKLDTMSPAEIEEVKLGLFYSQNKYGNDYIVNLLYPTTSDKSVSYGLRTFGFNWNNVFDQTRTITPKRLEWLYNAIVSPEINRILSVQDNTEKWDIKGYAQGGTMFNFIPSLNALKEIWIQEDNVKRLNPAILTDENLRNLVKTELNEFIKQLVDNKIRTWTDFGFVNEEEEGTWDPATGREFTRINKTLKYSNKNSVESEAANYVINYLVANVNIFQTFTTDPAFYWKSNHWRDVLNRENAKDTTLELTTREEALQYYTQEDWVQEHEDLFDNMGKRLAGDAAPGKDLPGSPNEVFTYGIIADSTKPAYLSEYYKGLLGSNASGYFKVNSTDAQEFTTLAEHLLVLHKEGKISKERMNDLLFKDKHEMELNEEELKEVLQPVKPVYVNNIWNNGIEHRLYVKSSSFPLFKQLTKNLELDKLRKHMESNSIDRVAFESAVKVGGFVTPSEIFKDGKIVNNLKIKTIQGVPREGFKIQQEVPYNENTNTINDGTQQRKLLTASVRELKAFLLTPTSDNLITGKEVQEHLDNAYNELFKINYNQLIKELKYNSKEGTLDMQALQKILVEEAISRDYPLYDLEALQVENNEFIVPLWATGVSSKIEAMLNSIVDNRVRKLKPKGKSYVLGTSEGFKLLEGKDGTGFIKNTQGIIFDKTWKDRGDNELRPMRIEDASGRVKGQEGFDEATASLKPAEVLVPFKFFDDSGKPLNIKDFMTSDGIIDITKLPSNLLEIFGFRIPTQGLSSMSYIKVVGFLPKRSGDLLIAPADWTVQMGSDFDVDKLFTNSYNTSYKDGKLTKYNGKDRKLQLENEILDLHFSILGSKDEKVQAMILKPLDLGKLPEVINEVYPYVQQGNKGISISEEYQTYKYRNARAAKSGVGVFSTDSTFLASVQGKNIGLTFPSKVGIQNYVFTLAGLRNSKISEVNTNYNTGRTKADVNSAIQSLTVDNENEQGMHKLNINNHTFDAIRTLVASGFEEDIVFYFMNQPIIRKYVELKTKADDSVTSYTVEDLDKEIKELFPLTDTNMDMNTFMTTYANPSKEEMLDMIKKGSVANPDVQRALYVRFKEFTKYGKKIQQVQSAINTDSAGLGKDLFYATAKEQQILNLVDNVWVHGASSLIGEYITLVDGKGDTFDIADNLNADTEVYPLLEEWFNGKVSKKRKAEIVNIIESKGYIATSNTRIEGDIKDTISFIKPTTINGFASVYGLLLNNALWGKGEFFPYNNIKIVQTTEAIKLHTDSRGESIRENADIDKRIFSEIKGFLATKFTELYTDGVTQEERYRLLMDTADNVSIASIVKDLRMSKTLNNAFINRLEFDINKIQLPSNVTYNASNTENINERSIYAAVAQMLTDDSLIGEYNGIQYSPKKIIQDLITHQLLTGGVQQSTQFLKYIPISYLKTLGYYDALKNINFNDEQEYNNEAFEIQYIQHKPNTVEIDITKFAGTYKFFNEGTVIMPLVTSNPIYFPDIFSIVNPKAVSGYSLYLKDKTSGLFKQIDTLGYKGNKGIKEYDASKFIGKTLIPLNKVKEDVEITLPETEKEIEEFTTIRINTSKDSEIIYNPDSTDISSYYNLRSNETSLNKFSFILNKIQDAGNNKYNSFLASQLHNNLDKLKEYRFILDSSLEAKGSFNMLDKTIRINLNNIENKEDFENIILEEIIHAYTKEALINNTNGEVARLKGLRLKALDAVRTKLGEGADIKINTTINKVKNGIPLNSIEEQLIYPVLNDVEFVGRLFKSKELQELLNNTPSDIEGKSVLERMWDLVVDLLNSIGIEIKKGSALEYATIDIISLINQKPPSTDIKGEMQSITKKIRTSEFIYERFNLLEDDGAVKILNKENAKKIAKWVKDNVPNLVATVKSFDKTGYYVEIINAPIDLFNMPPLPKGYTETEAYKNSVIENEKRQQEKENNRLYVYSLYNDLEQAIEEQAILMETSPNIIVANSLPKIEPNSARKETGTKVGSTKDINPSLLSNTGKTVQQAAHDIWERSFSEENIIDESEVREIIIDILTTGKNNYIAEYSNENKIKELQNKISNLEENLAPTTEQGRAVPYLKAINNRIERLELNIEKAEKRNDFKKVEELKDVLEDLIARRDGTGTREEDPSVMQLNQLRDIARKGEQDMQEIAEMLKRQVTLEDTLYIRKVIHFWKTAKETMFTAEDTQSKVLSDLFSSIANDAQRYEDTLVVLENKYMESIIKKYGKNLSVEDIFNHFIDINGLQRDFLDISRIGNPMLDSIFLAVKDANVDALDETREILKGLNELENKIRPILKSLGHTELYDIFRQRTSNGKLTGHMVGRYSSKFLKDKSNIKNALKANKDFNTYHNLLEWARKNTKEIELKYLFPTSELNAEESKKANEYKESLKQELGEGHYNDFMTKQAKLLEQYENFKQGRLEHIAEKYNVAIEDIPNNPAANTEYTNWLLVNSPYAYTAHMKTMEYGKVIDFKNFNSPSFINQIPKDSTGYDSNFNIIESNKDLLEFYDYYQKVDKTLKDFMPAKTRRDLAFNGIPYVEKVLFEEYKDKGMKIGLTPILDGIKESTRINMEGTVNNKYIDPVTEIEEKRLGINLTADNTDEYFGYINSKTVEYVLANGKEPNKEQLDIWHEEIIDKLAQEKSYDLPKVLKVYALTVLGYKHKAKIEDNIKLAQNILSKQREFERNSKGEIMTDSQNRLEPKSSATSFLNTKKQFDYFVQVFYGKTKENEGVTDTKIYTKEEKQRLANYNSILQELTIQYEEGKIDQNTYESYSDILNKQITNIGGVAVWSKRGDNILKYVQLKSMGWNMMSAIANIGFGFIANRLEGAGGQLYNAKQLGKAYRLTWHSLAKNWTFNKVESDTAKKIRSLMDKFDVLKDATHELFKNPLNIEVGKDKKWLTPYNLTQRTEYLNQAPVMIASMMNTVIDTDKGKINLWEGFDSNGEWNTEYGEEPKDIIKTLRHKIDQTNKMNHGNYDGNSPLRVKNEFKGRALSQFRTWMFEGVATRFESEKEDILLGTRKGRYVSLATYFKAVGLSKFGLNVVKGILNNVSFGVMFKGLDFDADVDGKTLKEIDAANMRKVMSEVVMLIGIYTSYLAMSLMVQGLDDEDDKLTKYTLNNLINQGIRLKTDILFYTNPNEFRNLLRDLIPAASLVKDGFDFIDAVHSFVIGEDEISTGVYSGNSRLLREAAQALPLGTQVYKNINYSVQTFDK